MVSILDKTKMIICKEDAVRITLTESPVLSGQQASTGLWKVPIVQKSAPRINLDIYYHQQIANNVVPTYKINPSRIFLYQQQHGQHKNKTTDLLCPVGLHTTNA